MEQAAGSTGALSTGTSDKFWSISCSGSLVTVEYGRAGTEGQIRTKDHGSSAAARCAANKQVAEKLRKGYWDAPTMRTLSSDAAEGVAHFRDAAQASAAEAKAIVRWCDPVS